MSSCRNAPCLRWWSRAALEVSTALDLPFRRGSQVSHPWTRLRRSWVTWFKKGPWDPPPAAMSSWAWFGGRPGLRDRVLGKDEHSCALRYHVRPGLFTDTPDRVEPVAGRTPRSVSPQRWPACESLYPHSKWASAQNRRLMGDGGSCGKWSSQAARWFSGPNFSSRLRLGGSGIFF